MGDQPEAIQQLVDGVQKGMKHQVLLGATGTGKSLGYDDHLYCVQENADGEKVFLGKIGQFIDGLFEKHDALLGLMGDTQILDISVLSERYFSFSFEPETGTSSLRLISAFTRHAAPEKMFRVQTACGRSAVMTGDHNLWVLRNGSLNLIDTVDVAMGDYLAIPDQLPSLDSITEINALPILDGTRLFVEAKQAVLEYVDSKENKTVFYDVLSASGIGHPEGKLGSIRRERRGRGIKVGTFLDLLETTSNMNGGYDPAHATIGGKRLHDRLPASISLTPEFLRLLGYYVAEGNGQSRYFVLANQNTEIRARIESALEQLRIPFFTRDSSDFQVSSTALTELLKRLCGSKAGSKKLPDFSLQLSLHDLGILLQAYFDGDGTVGRASDISATTASERLASDLAYALLRFASGRAFPVVGSARPTQTTREIGIIS